MQADPSALERFKHKRPILLASIDQDIMRFLWKWKISTTSVLHLNVAKDCSAKSINKRLAKLESHGVISSRVDYFQRRYLWELTDFGKSALDLDIHPSMIVDEKFRSENTNQDFWTQAFILSEWPYETVKPDFISSQEITRLDRQALPDWVPATDAGHRPLGFARVVQSEESKVFAFEVELTIKRASINPMRGLVFGQGLCGDFACACAAT